MKSIAAAEFKDVCLKTLDDVVRTRPPVVITRRGEPVAKLVPYTDPSPPKSLAGSILKESGDPFTTGVKWDSEAT